MQHPRHLHLRDADAASNGPLREILAEAQEHDLGVAGAQPGEELGKDVAVLNPGVSVIEAAATTLREGDETIRIPNSILVERIVVVEGAQRPIM